MTIDEAIKFLTEDTQHPTANFMPELQEAEKLGIEALKEVKSTRENEVPGGRLPSETE